jgi:phosphatidylglycerophosphate synthase
MGNLQPFKSSLASEGFFYYMTSDSTMTILQEYRNSLKMAEVEEPLDLVFYRPIAFAIVKLIYRLPITPNQVTMLSLGAGLVAAFYFSMGTPGAFMAAAIWYAASNVLDCCDGMLARLQGSGTPLGRLVDGIADWVIAVAIFLGLGVGLEKALGDPTVWYLVVAGGLTSALHAMVFDSQQQEYISNVRGKQSYQASELERTKKELQHLEESKASWWRKGALQIYLRYLKVQERVEVQSAAGKQFSPEVYRSHNLRIMRWWTVLGTTTNRSLLVVAALFNAPTVFLWIVVIAGNLFLLFILVRQRSVRRRMEALAN